jgi:hypothetical protein
MIPIVMFDFIDSVPWINDKFDVFYDQNEDIDIPDQTIALGYETHNPLLNMKSLSLMQSYYFLRVIFCIFLYLLIKYRSQYI